MAREELREIVLKQSDDKNNLKDLGIGRQERAVCGYEFKRNEQVAGNEETLVPFTTDFDKLMMNYKNIGFQASNLGAAIDIVNEMIAERNKWIDPAETAKDDLAQDSATTNTTNEMMQEKVRGCKIFLGYTSNLVSSGLRDMLRFLAQTNQVDVIVSSAGGIEEDFIKCLGDTYLGDFGLDGAMLRSRGLNRIGNLLVPNSNYCKFEDWVIPILDQLLIEQKRDGIIWSPSSIIKRLGKEINHPESIYYWAYKNDIPVYCPALTDGSLGDMIYFHSFKNPGLVVDIAADIRAMNDQAVFAKKTGMLILGGGVIKHHICNANLMRNGSDYAVYINTGLEFDGSDAGARCDEAVSWGKIRAGSKSVKVHADATLVFPLLISQTFAKNQ